MKIKVIIPVLLFISMADVYGSVTEKLAAKAERITELKNGIASGALNAKPFCRGFCKVKCQSRCKQV